LLPPQPIFSEKSTDREKKKKNGQKESAALWPINVRMGRIAPTAAAPTKVAAFRRVIFFTLIGRINLRS